MNGMILRSVAVFLMMGLAFWGPAIPSAFAQLEITPEIRAACEQFEPEIREIALTEIVPAIEAEPEGSEARAVETAAVAIAEAGQATQEVLANPDALVNSTVTALQSNGVPADVVAGVQAQLETALKGASQALSSGGTVEDVAKYFEACQKAMGECSGYLGGKDLKEIFGAGGAGFDRPEMAAFCAKAFDPGQRDGFGAVMEAHFSASMGEMMAQGGGMDAMRSMMEQMGATGINPAEMMAHTGGEFHGPSPEAMAAMSETDKTMFEAWQKGDFAQIEAAQIDAARAGAEAAGMDPAAAAREISHMREMMTMKDVEAMYREYTANEMTGGDVPRTESSGYSETQEQKYADGHAHCPAGTTHVGGVPEGPGHCS